MAVPGQLAQVGRPFRTVLRYNRRYWRAYLAGTLLAVIFSLVNLAMPLVMRIVVDEFTAQTMTMRRLWTYFSALLLLAVFVGIARYWQRTIMIRASRKFEYDLRNDYFRRIQSLSQDFFHHTPTGEIMARATNDLNYVRSFIGPGIMGTVDMLRLPFTLTVMMYFSLRLTLIALIPLPLVSLAVYWFVMYLHHQSKRVQDQFGVVTSRVQENLAGARVVQAYGAADREFRDFYQESEKYMRESVKLSLVMSFAWPFIGLMVGATILLVLWQGGNMVIDEASVSRLGLEDGRIALQTLTFTLGDLSGFLWCMFLLAWPLADFGWVLTLYQRGAVGMNRLSEFLVKEPSIRDDELTNHAIQRITGSIRFENVDFSYNGRKALHDVSFQVEPGETVAIVGPTGSGKSTIVSLITREYDPSSGVIRVDGHDARHIPLRTLRASIGYVPQDTFLFSDTVRANLSFGVADASDRRLDAACEMAQFAETLQTLPRGYDTMLGERGVNLSGGQKQRLAIARAVLRDAPILILDDALSSVDTHTEERVLQGLKDVMARRTSIIISHRVSTVQHAGHILVVDDGRIVERGTHEQLIALGGLYADMHLRQLLEEELEDEG